MVKLLEDLGVGTVLDGVMALVHNQEIDAVQGEISLRQQVQKDLVHHHHDVDAIDGVLPIAPGPEVDVVRAAKASDPQGGISLDELGLLGDQGDRIDQEDGLLVVAQDPGHVILDHHGGHEGFAAAGSQENDGILFFGFQEQLDLPKNIRYF